MFHNWASGSFWSDTYFLLFCVQTCFDRLAVCVMFLAFHKVKTDVLEYNYINNEINYCSWASCLIRVNGILNADLFVLSFYLVRVGRLKWHFIYFSWAVFIKFYFVSAKHIFRITICLNFYKYHCLCYPSPTGNLNQNMNGCLWFVKFLTGIPFIFFF